MIIWGNHSTTQVPDLSNCLLNAKQINIDNAWIQNIFIPKVQKRGGEIIEYRGLSSAASAASAIYDHINIIDNGSISWESLGIMTSGEYDIESGLMFSLPLIVTDKGYNVIEDLRIEAYIEKLIKLSEKELLKERDIVKSYLP
jgi:malate dehydrogenase